MGFLAPVMDWLREQQEIEGSNDDIVNPMYHIPDTLQVNSENKQLTLAG